MKKFIYVILILIFIVLIIPKGEENLRIRVIASSDTNYDQRIKYEVVEIVKKVISPNDSKNIIKEKFPILEEKIKNFLLPKGITFNMEIKDEYFPKKSLNGKVIAEGYYEALVIELGEGMGKNWWTLLYPEYFNISFEDIKSGEVEVKFYFWERLKKIFK